LSVKAFVTKTFSRHYFGAGQMRVIFGPNHLYCVCSNKTFVFSGITGPSLATALLVQFAAFVGGGVALADDDKWVWGKSDGQSRADSRIGSAASDEVVHVARPLVRDQTGRKPNPLFQAAGNPRLDTKRYR